MIRVRNLSPILVTSTRVERRLDEEPLRVEVLSGDDVTEKNEMRPADLRNLLAEMSGVRVQTTSPSLTSQRSKRATVFFNVENLTDVRLARYESVVRPSPGEGGPPDSWRRHCMSLRGEMAHRWRRARATLLAIVLLACGRSIAPAYHGVVSDHFDGRRFFNYERTPERQLEDAIGREEPGRHRGHWDKWQQTPTDTPPPRVAGGRLRVTFVNHSTVLVQTEGLNVLIDPVWSDRVSPLAWYGPKRHRPPGMRFEDLPWIDLVLISHNHYDHMDLPTLKRLVQAFHPRIVVGLGNTAFLSKNGITGAEDIDWWQSLEVAPGIRLTGVPARHWSARGMNDVDRTLWLGFVLETPSGRIYMAGDTGYGQFFTMIHDRFPSFRLALLPIAPARPRGAMAPRHMSAGDAARAAELLQVQTAVAIHFGTFQQGDDGEEEPVDSLRSALAVHPDLTFLALRNGESHWIPIDLR